MYGPTGLPQTPMSGGQRSNPQDLPVFDDEEPLMELIGKLSVYFEDNVDAPHTFEQLRTSEKGQMLRPLISFLSDKCHHPHIVSALLHVTFNPYKVGV